MEKGDEIKLTELNKNILEIKKKIQLSEGQRKALFEDCEAERKSNADEILVMKKEITSLVLVLHQSKSPIAKYRLKNRRIEEIIGPLADKTCDEVKELLDLQIIDQSKKLDLLKYKMKKRRKYIAELGAENQKFLSKMEKKELVKKVERPVTKSVCELQNNIHAVEVQIREATHIKIKYAAIRKSLKDDAAKFESRIIALEEELQTQSVDVEKLQKIMEEATKRRGIARGHLLREEKLASIAASQRELEAAEGRRLVSERKAELEKLEKRLFISSKIPRRPEPEGAEGDAEEEKVSTSPHPVEIKSQEFELLKTATGGTTTQEVLARFLGQRETEERLNELRNKSEIEKKKIENNLDALKTKLDGYKYSESREAEQKSGEMERLKIEITEQQARSETYKEAKAIKQKALSNVLHGLHGLTLLANPMTVPEKSPEIALKELLKEIQCIIEKYERCRVLEKAEDEIHFLQPVNLQIETKIQNYKILPLSYLHEGKMKLVATSCGKQRAHPTIPEHIHIPTDEHLPAPYSGLIRRTPQPQMMGSPSPVPPPGSDDEEEVPSRGYLKRQAQLVIDAKSRRKNLRIQLPKRI